MQLEKGGHESLEKGKNPKKKKRTKWKHGRLERNRPKRCPEDTGTQLTAKSLRSTARPQEGRYDKQCTTFEGGYGTDRAGKI